MEKEMTITEKWNLKEEIKLIRQLLKNKDLGVINLMTLKNSLLVADQSKSSKETYRLLSEIERRIRQQRN